MTTTIARTNAEAAALAAELERRHKSARDSVVAADRLLFAGTDADDQPAARIGLPVGTFGHSLVPLAPTAQNQLAETANVPREYARRIHDAHPGLWATTMQTLVPRERRYLARELDGGLRALLSDKYRVLDNFDLFFRTFGVAQEVGAIIQRATLTDDRFEMRFTVPEWQEVVDYTRTQFRGGYEHRPVESPDGGQAVLVPGLYVSNSETGKGGLNITVYLLDKVCSNGMVFDKALRQVHLGGQQDVGYLSREAMEKDSEAIWLRVRDITQATFDRERFRTLVEQYRQTGELILEDPTLAVGRIVKDAGLTDDDRQAILNELIAPSHGRNAGGTVLALLNAVTQRAQAYEASDPDKATELEQLGGRLITAPRELVAVR